MHGQVLSNLSRWHEHRGLAQWLLYPAVKGAAETPLAKSWPERGRPSAAHGPAPVARLRLATLCCHLLAPSRQKCPSPSFLELVASRSEGTKTASAPMSINFRHAERPYEPNLASRGHQARKSRVLSAAIRAMLCRSQRNCPGGRAMSFTRSAVAQ